MLMMVSNVRTGEALVNGGIRFGMATGNSLFQTGVNTVTGGGRVILAGARLPFQMASNAMRTLRDMF